METIEERAKKYKVLNKLAVKGEAVVFGSDYLSDFPFYTLMQKRVSDYAVYNRSLENLTVKQAKSVVDDCLKYLAPSNILISFGENETANEEFLQDYDELFAMTTQAQKLRCCKRSVPTMISPQKLRKLPKRTAQCLLPSTPTPRTTWKFLPR